ncbi:MAG TPA: hypothetical protein VFC78_18085 [Tepidisphaeraceae bacterium]|nr:hypothetical protein [Tepidisphaeraceae bacterium]
MHNRAGNLIDLVFGKHAGFIKSCIWAAVMFAAAAVPASYIQASSIKPSDVIVTGYDTLELSGFTTAIDGVSVILVLGNPTQNGPIGYGFAGPAIALADIAPPSGSPGETISFGFSYSYSNQLPAPTLAGIILAGYYQTDAIAVGVNAPLAATWIGKSYGQVESTVDAGDPQIGESGEYAGIKSGPGGVTGSAFFQSLSHVPTAFIPFEGSGTMVTFSNGAADGTIKPLAPVFGSPLPNSAAPLPAPLWPGIMALAGLGVYRAAGTLRGRFPAMTASTPIATAQCSAAINTIT